MATSDGGISSFGYQNIYLFYGGLPGESLGGMDRQGTIASRDYDITAAFEYGICCMICI